MYKTYYKTHYAMIYHDPKAFDQMLRDSRVKYKDLARATGLSRQILYDLRQPENARRLTLEKILIVAKALGVNPAKYFPELDDDAANIIGEPVPVYQAKKANEEIKGHVQDIIVELNRWRDEYITTLKYTISTQEQLIEELRKR